MMEMLLLPSFWQEKTPLLWMLPAPHADGASLNDNKIEYLAATVCVLLFISDNALWDVLLLIREGLSERQHEPGYDKEPIFSGAEMKRHIHHPL